MFLTKAKAKPKAIVTMDAVKDWKSPHVFDFTPDTIVGMENWRGRCFVYCEHSVWEIEEDYEGELRRKLVNYKQWDEDAWKAFMDRNIDPGYPGKYREIDRPAAPERE